MKPNSPRLRFIVGAALPIGLLVIAMLAIRSAHDSRETPEAAVVAVTKEAPPAQIEPRFPEKVVLRPLPVARSINGAAFTAIAPGAVRNVEFTDIVLITDSAHPERFLRLEVSR